MTCVSFVTKTVPAAVLAVALLAGTDVAGAATESKDFDAATIKTLEVRNGSGNVVVKAGSAARAVADKVKVSKNCVVTMVQDGERLKISAEETSTFFGGDCDVDFDVTVPVAVDVKIRVGAGDVNVSGLKGAVDFETGSGDVTVDGEVGKLLGKAGSGDVTVKGIVSDDVSVDVGSGDLDLAWGKAPGEGKASLVSGSGDLTVRLPAGTKVKTKLRTGSGELSNELGDSPDAKFEVSAVAGSGDLTVKKL